MQTRLQTSLDALQARAPAGVSVGIDIVQVSRIEESLEKFGDRFMHRLYSAAEIAYARAAPAFTAQRLAARFAAKEAALKALRIAQHGIDWRDLEVQNGAMGECDLVLHGEAKAAARASGIRPVSLSLSHEGDYAAAVVLAQTSTHS